MSLLYGIPSKIPCFPENLATGKILLQIRYDSYVGIFRPFGTISEVFKKSSAEDSVIPCFPESGATLLLASQTAQGTLCLIKFFRIHSHQHARTSQLKVLDLECCWLSCRNNLDLQVIIGNYFPLLMMKSQN